MKKITFQAWRGDFYDSYFNRLENGEWIKISFLKYLWLKIKNYRVKFLIT